MNSLETHIKELLPSDLLDLFDQLKTHNKKQLESIVAAIPDLIFLIDENGTYVDLFSTGKENLLISSKENLLGKSITDYFDKDLAEQFLSLIHDAIETHTLQSLEYELNLSGTKKYFEARVMPTHIKDDGKETVVVIVRDISEIRISRIKIEYLATHDALTNLPNRTLLFEHLDHSILTAKRNHSKLSLLFIDIDGFKEINDSYSHEAGDQLLKDFALRLSHISRESDIVGRLSGDEFLLILESVKEKGDILTAVEKIKTQLSEPFLIKDEPIKITVSIGIACYPDDGKNADQLIHAADQAMYHIKKHGKDSFTFYSKEKVE